MNRTDPIGAVVDSNPVLLARLQATVPGAGAGASRRSGEGVLVPFDRSGHATSHRPQAKEDQGWFRPACLAIRQHAWLILALGAAGVFLGYFYTSHIAVPLYRIQASLEVRNTRSSAHVEALAHILQSQSLVNSVFASLSASERESLVERPGFGGSHDPKETLHQRLDAVVIASAQVIDIELITPDRPAGTAFMNGLIEALVKQEKNETRPVDSIDRAAEEVAIIDPAIASLDPVSPVLSDNLLLGVAGGLILGVLIALVRKFAANTFGGPGSLSEVLGVRELGSIPERKLLGPAGSETPHAGVQLDSNDESLRYLRSSLLYHPGKQQVRLLAFTSAAPGEGKTTVVANLSMSLAATGRRILVIDGDLRRPRLHKLMQVPSGPGLADLLRRDPAAPPVSLSRYVNSTAFQNLYVLPPGTAGDDAPELLAGPHLSQLFRELGKSFDFVLIDTPPLLACSDARNYARTVEGVVLVVRSSDTQKRAALVARDMLLQDGATIIGTVLTGWRQENYPAYNYHPQPTFLKTQ